MKKIGLIAGEGKLPVIWANNAAQKGVQIITIGITPETSQNELEQLSENYYQVSVGELDRIINICKEEQIEAAVMLGKVEKVQLYQGLKLDQRLLKLLHGLKERNDDAILLAIVQEMASEGIHFLEQTIYLEEFMAKEGVLTPELELNSELFRDMEYGFKIAKEIGRLDIGQTVIVKDCAVIAVEAIEGTDKVILRSKDLASGVIVAKVSKPNQDFRFDIPTIGLRTMQKLVEVGAIGLVVEADKTFFIEQSEVLDLARANGIVVAAMR